MIQAHLNKNTKYMLIVCNQKLRKSKARFSYSTSTQDVGAVGVTATFEVKCKYIRHTYTQRWLDVGKCRQTS